MNAYLLANLIAGGEELTIKYYYSFITTTYLKNTFQEYIKRYTKTLT